MNDSQAMELLRLLHQYVTEYSDNAAFNIADLASDLAMSMDVTPDEADTLRREIEEIVGYEGIS